MKLGANVEYGAKSNNWALPGILIRGCMCQTHLHDEPKIELGQLTTKPDEIRCKC